MKKQAASFNICLIIVIVLFTLASQADAWEKNEKLYRQAEETYIRFGDIDVEKAIQLLEDSIAVDPSFSPAYSALAEAYLQRYFREDRKTPSLVEKAARAAERALFTDARSPQAHKAIASVFYARGKTEEAIEELERAIDMAPDYSRALLNLGTCWLELGNRGKALAFYRDAVKADNDKLATGIAYFNIASMAAEDKNFTHALDDYTKARSLLPGYYNIHYGMGTVLMNLDRNDDAVKAFQEVLRLKPDFFQGHMGLASAYHRLGKKRLAAVSYEEALRLDPDSEEAIKGLSALKGRKIGCLFIY